MDPDRDDAARLRRGDTAGLAGLMGRHQNRLFRYLLRLLGKARLYRALARLHERMLAAAPAEDWR